MDRIKIKCLSLKIKASLVSLCVCMALISQNANALTDQGTLPTQQFMINGAIYQIEIAQTRQQLQIGLMGRTSIARNKGMLFVFPQFRSHGIWMKNMLIPLKVAWLDKQLNVIAVKKLMPCQTKQCPVSKPSIASAYVVELNVKDKIRIGDKLIITSKNVRY